MKSGVLYIAVCACLLLSCEGGNRKLFTELDRDDTGIDFRNLLVEDDNLNVGHYLYFYNGAGVAIGDINNDGLQDVFFTGNMVKNRLFLNKGNFEFENITDQSHVAEMQGWCTGVTMVDINNDGWLDIYVSRSADDDAARRKNLLFINNHDLTFTESADKYGLADSGYSTQAAFFDYDKDGDLDCFVLNHSVSKYSVGVTENPELRKIRNPDYASRLYRNENGSYRDVSDSAGIVSNVLSFGLGVALSDFNNDGWPDIYVSNDFKEADYLYLNNQNGTFTESFSKCMDVASLNSMGSDAADYNNDGLTDLITLDMLAEDNYLQKTHAGPHNFDKTAFLISKGFAPQYMRNMLHKNNGDGTFSEIGQMAGVSNTDWSWSALFCDYDADGNKDLFISNGFVKDFSDLDFINYSTDKLIKRQQQGTPAGSFEEGIARMPTIKISNYIYRNDDSGAFTNKTEEWGVSTPAISSGAAYGDLDNDGDMDLVVSNTNDYAFVYRNNARETGPNNFVRIQLSGGGQNRFGIGAKVYVYAAGKLMYQEQFPARGYQSSVDFNLIFGVGTAATVDSIRLVWPNDRSEVKQKVAVNQTVIFREQDARENYRSLIDNAKPLFVPADVNGIIHEENSFNDFTVQTLLVNYLSRQGPCLAKGDVNGDGLEDLYTGGAKGQPAKIYLQDRTGNFRPSSQPAIEADAGSEDTDAVFFDANGDRWLDLYVASGGYEFGEGDELLQDRLYLNNSNGVFVKSVYALPAMRFSKGTVEAGDVDGDNDIDLFVGGRVVPAKYPLYPSNMLLVNDGGGKFRNAISEIAPDLEKCGMVTDAAWIDINNDSRQDLVVAGDWMPLKVFVNGDNKLVDQSAAYINKKTSGWWSRLAVADMDKDGDLDIIAGNYGRNTQFRASESQPATLYFKDFDGNGSIDPLFCYYIKGESFPAASRDDLVEQIPSLKKKFNDYATYAKAGINDILTKDQLDGAGQLNAVMMESVFLENNAGKNFEIHALPPEVQYAPVFAIVVEDVNGDGNLDVVCAGNNTWTRVQFGRHLANHGTVLTGDGKGNFEYMSKRSSGLNIRGDVRDGEVLNTAKGKLFLFGVNDAPASGYLMAADK